MTPPTITHKYLNLHVYSPQKKQDSPRSETNTHEELKGPQRRASLTQHMSDKCKRPVYANISSIYCQHLYINNVKMYEISTSEYLHIVRSIHFRVYDLMMAT